MAPVDQLLFAWTYRVEDREFVIEIFRDGNCILYDETVRRQLCHTGKTWRDVLLEEIEADEPSQARTRKTEFGIRFAIDSEQRDLIQRAREEFDQKEDVSTELERQINSRFDPIFSAEVKPFLAIPLTDL